MTTEATLQLRNAAGDDAHEIARSYSHYVQTSFYTFEEVPPEAAEMQERLRRISDTKLPWWVAAGGDGEVLPGAEPVGYARR